MQRKNTTFYMVDALFTRSRISRMSLFFFIWAICKKFYH